MTPKQIKTREAALYKALRDLECCLQELGERGDYGVPTEPNFAADTLFSALEYVSRQKGADKAQILKWAQDFAEYVTEKKHKYITRHR
jgi:hypothetical protein